MFLLRSGWFSLGSQQHQTPVRSRALHVDKCRIRERTDTANGSWVGWHFSIMYRADNMTWTCLIYFSPSLFQLFVLDVCFDRVCACVAQTILLVIFGDTVSALDFSTLRCCWHHCAIEGNRVVDRRGGLWLVRSVRQRRGSGILNR